MRVPVKALMVGLLTVVLIFAAGEALAADVPSATDSDNTLGATVASDAPEITNFQITDSGNTNLLHAQLDVSTTYYFNVTVGDTNGWADIKWINIRVWFDGGTEVAFDSQTTGDNYRVDLNYTNVAPLDEPALSEWNITEGNSAYNSGDSANYTNVANQNFTFNLSFSFDAQIRQADLPSNTAAGSYNDANSWNAEIRAKDTDNVDVINRGNATNVYHEFGVYKFTSVTIASNWDAGTIAPGASGTSAIVTVTHQSNRDYKMKVWFDTTLTSGGNTIGLTNINITAAGDANDNITSDLSFSALGEANAVYIRGTSTWNWSHNVSSDQETTGVQFRVFVPFGSAAGSYTATLTIKVEIPA